MTARKGKWVYILWIVAGGIALLLCLGYVAIQRAGLSALQRAAHPSPLADAVTKKDTARVKALLETGSDPNSQMNASYQLQPEGELRVAVAVPIFGSASPEPGMSLLAFAAMQGSVDIVDLLLKHGARVNARDKFGQTALIAAAWKGDTRCIRLLLDDQADAAIKDNAGKTALQWARDEGHAEAVRMLQAAGAKE